MSDNLELRKRRNAVSSWAKSVRSIVLENEHVRIWEINLDPGETIDFHIHYHPYVVVSLGGGENEIETIFGERSRP